MEVDGDDAKPSSSSTDNNCIMDQENVHSNLESNLEMKRKVEKCDGFDLPKAKVKKMKFSFDIEQMMSDTSISDNESEAKKLSVSFSEFKCRRILKFIFRASMML